MPRSSATNIFGQDTTLQWFLCPLKSCQRACKSKTGWTRHLRSVHPHLDISQFQCESVIVNLPLPCTVPTLSNRHNLASSPPTSPVDFNFPTGNDFDIEMVNLDMTEPEMPSSPSQVDPDADSECEYHPIINGKSLSREFILFRRSPINTLQVDHATSMVIR